MFQRPEDRKTTPLPPAMEKLRTLPPQGKTTPLPPAIEKLRTQGKTKPPASSMQDVASRRAALQNSGALTTPGSRPGAGPALDSQGSLAIDPRALALQVLNRQWGNGLERKQRLTEAGFDYQTVQDVVNQYVWNGIPEEELAQFGRFASAPGAGQTAPGAAGGRSVMEQNLTDPPIPKRGGRVASNYNLGGTQRTGNASLPTNRDVLGNSGLRELYRY